MEPDPVTPVCTTQKIKADNEATKGAGEKRGRRTTPARTKMAAVGDTQQTESVMEKFFKDLGESLTKKSLTTSE